MTDDQTDAALHAILHLAITMRDEGPDAVREAAQGALQAAGDPIAALTAAAALIPVDKPIDAWWLEPLPVLNHEPLHVVRAYHEPVALVRQRTKTTGPKAIYPCGTHAAFNRHKNAGEPVDDACLIAEREYQAGRREIQKERRREGSAIPKDRYDESAIQRGIVGTEVNLSRREAIEVIRRLTRVGYSSAEIAELTGMSQRNVVRLRALVAA